MLTVSPLAHLYFCYFHENVHQTISYFYFYKKNTSNDFVFYFHEKCTSIDFVFYTRQSKMRALHRRFTQNASPTGSAAIMREPMYRQEHLETNFANKINVKYIFIYIHISSISGSGKRVNRQERIIRL